MAWDFETDPEFQRDLDWMDEFVREEIEPLDFILGHPNDFTDPKRARAYAVERGLEGCTTDVGRLIEVDPEHALNHFRDLAQRGVSAAVFNDGPYGFYAPLDRFCDKAA